MSRRFKGKSWHHRKPVAHGGQTSKHNMVLVDTKQHVYFHYLFKRKNGSPMTPEEIGIQLSQVWIDPEWEIIVRRKQPQVAFTENPQQFGERKGLIPP